MCFCSQTTRKVLILAAALVVLSLPGRSSADPETGYFCVRNEPEWSYMMQGDCSEDHWCMETKYSTGSTCCVSTFGECTPSSVYVDFYNRPGVCKQDDLNDWYCSLEGSDWTIAGSMLTSTCS